MKKTSRKSMKKSGKDDEELLMADEMLNDQGIAGTAGEMEMLDDGEENFMDGARVIKTFKVKP